MSGSAALDDPTAMTCGQAVLEEFHPDRVGLAYGRPTDFVLPQWSCRKRWFLVYRAAVALTLTGWAIGDAGYETAHFYEGAVWRWFLYATNWSLLALTFSAIMQCVTSSTYCHKAHWVVDPQLCRHMPWVLRVQWLLLNVAYNSAIVVTVAYWSWIFFIVDDLMLHKTRMNQMKHTANSLYVLLDLCLMATPIRLFHVFYTIFLGSCYILVNGLFFLDGRSLSSTFSSSVPDAFSSLISPSPSPLPPPLVTSPSSGEVDGEGGRGGLLDSLTSSPRVLAQDEGGPWSLAAEEEDVGFRVRGWGGMERTGHGGASTAVSDIYNYLNWHRPVQAIMTCVMAMLLCLVAQILLFLLFRLRLWLARRWLGADAGAARGESELQNIIGCSRSSSYNSTFDPYEGADVEGGGGGGYFNPLAVPPTAAAAAAASIGAGSAGIPAKKTPLVH